MRVPKTIYSVRGNLLFVGGLVLYVYLFATFFRPDYWMVEGLCRPICCAIILVTTALSRTLLLLTTHTARIRESDYLIWQAGEVTMAALGCNLFLSLYLNIGYIENLPITMLVYFTVALSPYAFYWLLAERMDRDQRIAEAQKTIVRLRQAEERNGNEIIRFADEKGTVRLMVSTERVVCVEGDGNYVNILYETNGKLTRYNLRNTMKALEGLNYNLVRCHRGYYINLKRIKLLRKAPDGIYAEMDAEGVKEIPVSKNYAADVIGRFA